MESSRRPTSDPGHVTLMTLLVTLTFSTTVRAASDMMGGGGGGGRGGGMSMGMSYHHHNSMSGDSSAAVGNGGGVGGGGGASVAGSAVLYPRDYDDWAAMSGRVQKPKCVDIPSNLSLCRNMDYTRMMLPNLLQHDSLDEAVQQSRSWVPLVGIHCHPDTQVFLCSLFSPVCLDRKIYPCRSLCQSVRDSCSYRMEHYGFSWPDMLNCSRFPEDNDLCIRQRHATPDNNCSACKHPATYEAIIDNYCRAEFVSRVKIDHTEIRGQDRALVLKKSKRYYKKENITKKERSSMEPLIPKGASCACDVINDTSKRYLMMGAHSKALGGALEVSYVMEFLRKSKDFRRAFKDMRKGNVCRSIIDELSAGDVDKKAAEKDDGICIACKMPVRYLTIVENYCLADFVLRVSVTGMEDREGHQALLMKKRRKNYKRGSISRREVRSMVPLLDGREGCACPLIADNPRDRLLVFGFKQDERHYINYVTLFNTKDKEFKKAIRAIRKGDACVSMLQGPSLGLGGGGGGDGGVAGGDDDSNDKKKKKKKGGDKKKKKKGGKGGKGKKGKKGGKRKGRKGGKKKGGGGKKKGRRGEKKRNNNNNNNNNRNSSASGLVDNVA